MKARQSEGQLYGEHTSSPRSDAYLETPKPRTARSKAERPAPKPEYSQPSTAYSENTDKRAVRPQTPEPQYTNPPRTEPKAHNYILPRPIYSDIITPKFERPKVVKPKYEPPAPTYAESTPEKAERPKAARPTYVPPKVAYWDDIDQQDEFLAETALPGNEPTKIMSGEDIPSLADITLHEDTDRPLPQPEPIRIAIDEFEADDDEADHAETDEYEPEGIADRLRLWVRTKLLRRVQQVAGLAIFIVACYSFTDYVGRMYSYANDQNHVNLWSQQRFEDFYALPEGWLDMVFLGSSHSFTTFDPAQFEGRFNAFQLGMPLQTPDSSFFTLLEVYRYQQPDIVVMELYWNVMRNDFEAAQVETFFRVLRSEELRRRYIEEVLPLNERVMYEVEAIRHQAAAFAFANAQIRNFVRDSELFYEEGFVEDLPQGIEYYRSLGYVYSNLVMTQTEFERIRRTPARELNFTIAPRQRHFLEEMIRLTQYHGSQLIFVTAPISNVSFANILDYDEIHREISGFAAYHGIPYLDFHLRNLELNLFDDDMFRDHGHLNHRGAMVAGEYFMQWLDEVLH